ncbi:MAG: hypothetical protein ACM3KJ_02475, partial [Bacillota bacterium]
DVAGFLAGAVFAAADFLAAADFALAAALPLAAGALGRGRFALAAPAYILIRNQMHLEIIKMRKHLQ